MDHKDKQIFDSKGLSKPQANNENALKVRRITQIVQDLSVGKNILDLGCGEGVYSIELSMKGFNVTAIDGRMDRMKEGIEIAKRNNLKIDFQQEDIRNIKIGDYDTILMLGILYHLDSDSVYKTLKNLLEIGNLLIIDTHISLNPNEKVKMGNAEYSGEQVREHFEGSDSNEKKKALQSSLDNDFSFWLSKVSLFQLLKDIGYTTIFECIVPFEPNKPSNRVTIVAKKGVKSHIQTYNWINDMSDKKLNEMYTKPIKSKKIHPINRVLKKFGIKLTKL